MPAKEQPTDAMPDILVVDKPQDIKLIFSEKHSMVLKLVIDLEKSGLGTVNDNAITLQNAFYLI